MFVDNPDSMITSSIGAGGRYDKIIGQFMETEEEYPAVGMTFGVDVLMEVLKELSIQKVDTNVEYLIIPMIGYEIDALTFANKLREAKLKIDVDLSSRKVKKSLNSANLLKIPYVSVYGEDEKNRGKIKIKNMEKGEELVFDQTNITEICDFVSIDKNKRYDQKAKSLYA